MTDVLDTVKNTSKIATKGINAVGKLVDKVVDLGDGIEGTVRKIGDKVGLIGADILKSIKNVSPQKAKDFISKITDPVSSEKLASYKYIQNLCSGTVTGTVCQKVTGEPLKVLRAEHNKLRVQRWKKVSEVNVLERQWSPENLERMKTGRAPIIDGERLEFHHIVPLSWGGSNDLDNLVIIKHSEHVGPGVSSMNHNPPFDKFQPNTQFYGL